MICTLAVGFPYPLIRLLQRFDTLLRTLRGMDPNDFTNLALSSVLCLLLLGCIALLASAILRWVRARSLWAEVITREGLNARRVWSRVKVWAYEPSGISRRLWSRPVYGMMYADGERIHLELQAPVNDQLTPVFNRTTVASYWARDRVTLKSGGTGIQFKAIGSTLPVSSPQQTDAFWGQLQPGTAEPFENGNRRFDIYADRRSKIALAMLAIVTLLVVIEILFLNTYVLIDTNTYAQYGWVPMFIAAGALVWMVHDQVPSAESGAVALLLIAATSLAGFVGVKRVDQWISSPASKTYVLAINGARELVPADTDGVVIKLAGADPAWNDAALGSRHAVTVHGGLLGTRQIDLAQLLPSQSANLAN